MHHIDMPTRSDIETLFSFRGFPAVSIYLPTTPITQDTRANRIELKNLLRDATIQMTKADIGSQQISLVEDNVDSLIDDDGFWAEQANSLAVFVTPKGVRTFRLPNKLNSAVEVSDRFHVGPLIRSVTFPHNAFVLSIGMGAVRLIEVSADIPPTTIQISDLPRDAADALNRRSHLARPGDMNTPETTSENALLSRYSRVVDAAIRPILTGQERPLILAAAEPMASIFRRVCNYPFLTDEVISGSSDHTPDHELAAESRRILDGVYASKIAELSKLYSTRENQGRATIDLAQAARAATFGAIDTLIVNMDADVSGSVDDAGAIVFSDEADATDYGIVNEIACRAWKSGAQVLAARATDIPGGRELAALLRYAA